MWERKDASREREKKKKTRILFPFENLRMMANFKYFVGYDDRMCVCVSKCVGFIHSV